MRASAKPSLARLRDEIDRIDAAMHDLLIQRGQVIDQLIDVKARQGHGSAFRPDREASIMRAIAERHRGMLPLDTVEGIWRIIISTFTYIQAPYRVHFDLSCGEAAMRDSARFHFGFTVPCVPHGSANEVIRSVAESNTDLGMCGVGSSVSENPWWSALTPPETPKVIARLPFVERTDHPAGMPVFIVSRPLADGLAREIVLEAIILDRWRPDFPQVLRSVDAEVIGSAASGAGLCLLVSRKGALASNTLSAMLNSAGAVDVRSTEVGAYADRLHASALRAEVI